MSKREIPQVVTDLQAIRDRLTPRNMWSQGAYGKTEGPNCLMGAIFIVTGIVGKIRIGSPIPERAVSIERSLRDTIRQFHGIYGIVSFNDESTHTQVLEVIDTTIQNEKQKAGIVEYV